MTALSEYIAGSGATPTRRELNRLIERHEWFTTARRARTLVTGEPDPALTLPLMFRPTVAPVFTAPPPEVPDTQRPVDLIDRFIEHGGYRIVPTDEACEVEVDIDIDPAMVTPQLADIYRSQGLIAEAEKIDRLLKGAR